jgi:serine protease inhibitor
VEVDETGTVAVGATSAGIGAMAVQDPVNVVVNQPFFYAIRDNTAGDLLFVGVLMNPGAG